MALAWASLPHHPETLKAGRDFPCRLLCRPKDSAPLDPLWLAAELVAVVQYSLDLVPGQLGAFPD